jgi:hypothetical protein
MSSLSSINISNENNSNSSSSISSIIDINENVNLKEHEIMFDDDDIDKNNGENNSSYHANSLSYLSSSKRKPSWVWSVDKHAEHVFCLLCQEDVFHTGTRSTGMLERHVKRKHSDLFKQALRTGAKKVPKIDVSQVSMKGFAAPYPTFEQCLLNWAVETYQPL